MLRPQLPAVVVRTDVGQAPRRVTTGRLAPAMTAMSRVNEASLQSRRPASSPQSQKLTPAGLPQARSSMAGTTVQRAVPDKRLPARLPAKLPSKLAQPTARQQLSPRGGSIIQAVKLYPNLHPGAVESVDPASVFRLNSFANQYRLQRLNSHGVNVPNQQYNFVRTREGEMLLHSRYRHPSIAEGKQVLYAGEIFFNNGQLEWWSNGSGHYQPYVEDAQQASLPMDQFFSYQQVIKGEHKRKKGATSP